MGGEHESRQESGRRAALAQLAAENAALRAEARALADEIVAWPASRPSSARVRPGVTVSATRAIGSSPRSATGTWSPSATGQSSPAPATHTTTGASGSTSSGSTGSGPTSNPADHEHDEKGEKGDD